MATYSSLVLRLFKPKVHHHKYSKASAQQKIGENSLTSIWGIGWRTPTLMVASFSAAIIIAGIHLGLFLYLDGKIAAGPDQEIPQSYISTSSNILATSFQIALQLSLGTAFVQYLWHLLRVSTLRVSTIESLFSIRTSPFLVFEISTLRSAPMLVCLAALIWTTYVSTSFPPGAITIESEKHTITTPKNVPTFNASFMGNGSGVDASLYALDVIELYFEFDDGVVTLSSQSIEWGMFQPVLQRMANSIVVSGNPISIPSPCGVNCSYTVTFDAPWLQCQDSWANTTRAAYAGTQEIYSGYWINSLLTGQQFLTPPGIYAIEWGYDPVNTGNANYPPSVNSFRSNTLSVFATTDNYTVVVATQHNITCTPSRANYAITNIYENNVQTMNITSGPSEMLANVGGRINITGFSGPFYNLGTMTAKWTPDTLAWYRDLNLMNLIGVTMESLAGSYVSDGYIYPAPGSKNGTYPGVGPVTYGVEWEDTTTQASTYPSNHGNLPFFTTFTTGPQNGTLIANSRLNNNLVPHSLPHQATPSDGSPISFTVTEALLNELLLNVTLSAITTYGFWQTTTNVSIDNLVTIYSFSKPINLLLPYGLSLIFAIPFITLGLWALHQNGVPATDGGFMQLMSTSNGSAALKREAIKGCLGGKENQPVGLKELKIRFGELKGKDKYEVGGMRRKISRAGFGVEGEVVPLKKGADYGIVDQEDSGVGWV